MILTDVRQNKTPGSRHTSLLFFPDPALMSLDLAGNLFANFKVSVGQLQKLDGTIVQPIDNIYLGDQLKVVLNAPNSNGASAASIIYQNDVAVGYFVVTTENTIIYSYDSRYNNLFTSEVVPDLPWVPAIPNSIKAFDFDGNLTGEFDLTVTPTNRFAQSAVVALDYQRNSVKVFDTDTKTLAKVLNGSGPISSSNLFGTDRVRAATAIAYHKAGNVKIYDSFFSEVLTLTIADVAGVHFHQNTLYAWTKTGSRVFAYTINPLTLTVTSQTTHDFLGTVQAVISNGNQPIILSETEIVNLADSVLGLLDLKARNAVVNNGILYVTHGYAPYVTKINLSDFSSTRLNILNSAFLDSITVQSSGRIYVTDVEAKKIYAREEFNQDWDIGFGGYGIALNDQIYVFDAYDTMPSKIDVDTLQYTLDATAFIDINDFPLGAVGSTGAVNILTANRPVKVQLFPASEYTVLIKNGLIVDDETTVVAGDVLSIQFDFEYGLTDPMLLGLVIDQETFVLNVFLDDSRIVPFDFKFESQFGVSPNISVTSNIVTISHLTAPVTVDTDVGQFVKNGLDVGNSITIANGDTLAVRLTSSPDFCEEVTARITIQDPRFETPFTVSTMADLEDSAENARPQLIFDAIYDQPLGKVVYSSEIRLTDKVYEPTVFTIPDFYDAEFIQNGSPAGKQITARTNDTVQIKLVTTYNYDTAHHIAISTCYGVGLFVAYTIGDITPDPFNFGTIQGAHIKDYLVSDTATINGIGTNVPVPVLIPYGTKLFRNNVLVSNPKPVDWRGMPLDNHAVLLTLNNGDSLRLEGYPRPLQGDTVNIPVYVGGRRGTWTINTFDSDMATTFEYPKYSAPALDLYEADWTFDIDVPRSYDVQVITSSKISSASAVQVQTVSNKANLTFNDYDFVKSNGPLSVEAFNALHINKPLINFDYDREITIPNGYEFIQPDALDIFLKPSNHTLEIDPLTDFYLNATNQLYTTLDQELVVINTHVLGIDQDLQIHLNATTVRTFDYNPEYYVTHFNSHNCTVVGVDRFDAIKTTYNQINVLTEFIVVSFDYKPFELFDLSDGLVFNYAANPKVERDFVWQNVPWLTSENPDVIYHGQPLVQIDATGWMRWHENDAVRFDPEFKVIPEHDHVYYVNQYKVESTETVYYTGTYKVGNAATPVKFDPIFVKDGYAQAAQFTVEAETRKAANFNSLEMFGTSHEKSRRILLDRDLNAIANKISSPILFDLITADFDSTRFDVVVGQEPPIEQSRTYLRSPQPYTLHPGYFTTKALAEANALAHGYVTGQFYALEVEEKGWAWSRVIPCANLCNPDDCPPSGYIHGG